MIKTLITPDTAVVWSMIKTWKRLETGIYSGLIERNDLNYALLHLCNLEHTLKTTDKKDILVERGVSDMSFYRLSAYRNIDPDASDKWIREAIEEELRICQCQAVHKILLVQNDREFIENVVLSEKTRREVFPDLDTYLKCQDQYVKFCEQYNDISEVITINNAKSYLESLGIEYNEELCKSLKNYESKEI
jgi:hypothetical protein